jgi:hypothetical protein
MDPRLNTIEGCRILLNDLFETPPEEIGKTDIAVLNLLCAQGLPGAENLDIPKYLSRLENLAGFVRERTDLNTEWLRRHPNYDSEAKERVGLIVRKLKLDFGATYHPIVLADLQAGIDAPFTDSSEDFIHGVLHDDPHHRWGTCSSFPVVVTAIARRLGYPVSLAVNLKHIYARWDGKGERFNIEASNPEGMTTGSDEHYRQWPAPLPPEDERSGYYLRSLTPAEEFAEFMHKRTRFLHDLARYEEALLWAARALQFAPDNPRFWRFAAYVLHTALQHRVWRRYPKQPLPAFEDVQPVWKVMEFLRMEERSLFLTIEAHRKEGEGGLDEARVAYEDACRQNFHGSNEQRDLQRFLRKHHLSPRARLRVFPNNLGQPRRFKLLCRPEEEVDTLRRLSDEFESKGEFLKARDALHDLYLFNPCRAEVFQRARALEKQPQFQRQLVALFNERRKVLGPHNPGTPSNNDGSRMAVLRGITISGAELSQNRKG